MRITLEAFCARQSYLRHAGLEALEDRHISRVLQKQQELGLGVFTDDELRRSNFMSGFIDAVMDSTRVTRWPGVGATTRRGPQHLRRP